MADDAFERTCDLADRLRAACGKECGSVAYSALCSALGEVCAEQRIPAKVAAADVELEAQRASIVLMRDEARREREETVARAAGLKV